jgi:hypothetical protein
MWAAWVAHPHTGRRGNRTKLRGAAAVMQAPARRESARLPDMVPMRLAAATLSALLVKSYQSNRGPGLDPGWAMAGWTNPTSGASGARRKSSLNGLIESSIRF